jgi:hypothetical protein
MLQLYGTNRKASGVSGGRGAEGGSGSVADPRLYRERSNTNTSMNMPPTPLNTSTSSASTATATPKGGSVVLGVEDALDSMGFQVGCQLGERYSKNKARSEDTLDIVKFLCKDFWTEVFKKQIDNLKTNHKGVFVLYDSKFRWLRLASVDKNGTQSTSDLLRFPCGLIRGALFTLGIDSSVSADISSALPACSFTVKIRQK